MHKFLLENQAKSFYERTKNVVLGFFICLVWGIIIELSLKGLNYHPAAQISFDFVPDVYSSSFMGGTCVSSCSYVNIQSLR